MDENGNPEDVRQSLYEEFLSEVVKAGNPEAFFDENDLVEIFDYSSDMDNYIAKMEVLLYGARHYPDSQALATRRAWFYTSFGEMDAAAELNRRVSNGGVLNELLKLRAECIKTDFTDTAAPQEAIQLTLRENLDRILASTDDFGDEELIQLVDFCAESDLLSWVDDNYELVKSKCSYPQTFIYEYANRCEDMGNPAKAVTLFEELTMLEPFTLDFWERLAAAQYRAEQYEGALSSADYALAISPTSIEARRVKAMSLYSLDRDTGTIIEILKSLLASSAAIDSDLSVFVGAMMKVNDRREAVRQIKLFVDSHPTNRVGLGLLLTLAKDDAIPYLKEFEKTSPERHSIMYSWAIDEYLESNLELAARIVIAATEITKPDDGQSAIGAEILFRNEMFDHAANFCEDALQHNTANLLALPSFIFAYIISLIRIHRFKDAVMVAKSALETNRIMLQTTGQSLLPTFPGLSPIAQSMLTRGYIGFLKSIISDLTEPDSTIDPATYLPNL
ncbi:MAG: hypothetical protein NC039_05975 [Muribaculaceae bacterium]|nr:hypothetical protein [Muribaculaceae bacterium]